MRPSKRQPRVLDLPSKASRVLGIILFCFFLVAARVWYLAVLQHDHNVEVANRPQRKRVWESAERGTIRDRFGQPMAVNRVQYNAAVSYADIREVPRWVWGIDSDGKKVRQYKRKEHIHALSQLLGRELELDPERVEDLIYSKAALFQHLPFVLKENIAEDVYYRLRLMEKDWPGITAMRVPRRHYPLKKVAGDVIGYMGAINREEYDGILSEIRQLSAYTEAIDAGLNPPLPPHLDRSSEAFERLELLRNRAYTLNDVVGKTGLEGYFERELRGYKGQKCFYVDAKGNFLRELPGGKEPLSGQQLTLALSGELQAFAEKLLIQNEGIREGRSTRRNRDTGLIETLRQPWIKGGAIVAMDPSNGEVLALASYPRFDPNDFIPSGDPVLDREKRANVQRWLESEDYLAAIWDQKRPLEREVLSEKGEVEEELLWMSWSAFLDSILPKESELRERLRDVQSLRDAVAAQQTWKELLEIGRCPRPAALINFLYHSTQHEPLKDRGLSRKQRAELEELLMAEEQKVELLRSKLRPFIEGLRYNYDKILFLDLCALAAGQGPWPDGLLEKVGQLSLDDYRDSCAAMAQIRELLKEMAKACFHEWKFKPWRESQQRRFLAERRKEERLAGQYQKPYLDYLDKEERRQFDEFWDQYSWDLMQAFLHGKQEFSIPELEPFVEHFSLWYEELAQGAHTQLAWNSSWKALSGTLRSLSPDMSRAYLQTMTGFEDLTRPLWGRYPSLRREKGVQLEKHLAAAFYPTYGFGFGRSHAYRQGVAQGSIFKLVTGYAALVQRYQELMARGESLKKLNPLEIVDQMHRATPGKRLWNVGYRVDGRPIPQQYKGGRIVSSVSRNIGAVDLPRALERSSNPYFALLASDHIKEPRDLVAAARDFSYGMPTGVTLTGEYAGRLPTDLDFNPSGLFEFAIGQHAFTATPLQTAVMLSTLSNGGKVFRPKMVSEVQASVPVRGDELIFAREGTPYQDYLSLLGVDYPLFVKGSRESTCTEVKEAESDIRREIFLPEEVRGMLLDGMRRAVWRTQTRSIYGLLQYYDQAPEATSALQSLKGSLLGKSSTTEVRESVDLDARRGSSVYNHIWWGGISVTEPFSTNAEPVTFNVSEDGVDLVVVVYLRYGGYGAEAAPLAAQVVKKWREIRERERLIGVR